MADLRNIWRHLQDHEIAPPADVSARLRPMLPLETGMPDDDMKGNLNRLGQVGLNPPAFIRSSIEKRIAGLSSPASLPAIHSRIYNVLPIGSKGFQAIAACLLVIAASWGIFKAINGRKQSMAITNNRGVTGGSSAGKSAQPTISDSLSARNNPAMADTADNAALSGNTPSRDSNTVAAAGKYRLRNSFNVNGQSLHLQDNDILFTLCNFKYNEVPGFLNTAGKDLKNNESLNSKEALKIHVDQYTNIFITKPMLGMMQDMNTFRSNGELTRKGRKARAKLDSWKKADSKQFDQSRKDNPLDPIDLANFIFK